MRIRDTCQSVASDLSGQGDVDERKLSTRRLHSGLCPGRMTAFGRTLARKRSGGKTSCFAVVCLLIAFMVIVVRSESSMLGSYRVADDAVSPTIPMYSGE